MKSKSSPIGNIRRFRATLDGVEHEVIYQDGEVLLDCMLDADLDPPYQCHDAQCATCMVKLIEGKVEMHKTDALSRRDIEQGYVLLCQSIPLSSDVWVDCDD